MRIWNAQLVRCRPGERNKKIKSRRSLRRSTATRAKRRRRSRSAAAMNRSLPSSVHILRALSKDYPPPRVLHNEYVVDCPSSFAQPLVGSNPRTDAPQLRWKPTAERWWWRSSGCPASAQFPHIPIASPLWFPSFAPNPPSLAVRHIRIGPPETCT